MEKNNAETQNAAVRILLLSANLSPWGQLNSAANTLADLIKTVSSQKEKVQLIELQAKLAKEYAIARRIDMAERVTIEEHYESRGTGKLTGDVKAALKSGSADVSANGEHIVKRIYTFDGVREITQGEVDAMKEFYKTNQTSDQSQ